MPLERFSKAELLAAGPGLAASARTVRLQDVDAAGVVFFPRILELFNDALMDGLDRAGVPLHELLLAERILLPVSHAEADFLAPLRLGDRLQVGIARIRVSRDEAIVGYRIACRPAAGDGERVAAVGQTHHVCASAETFLRRPFSETLAAALRTLAV